MLNEAFYGVFSLIKPEIKVYLDIIPFPGIIETTVFTSESPVSVFL